MPTWDSLFTNVDLATMTAGDTPYGAIEKGALAIAHGRIAWVGAAADLPHRDAAAIVDGEGGWLTPGLIDCHTHLVFAGDRSGEFEQRLMGVSYEEIARAGGGIARTVAATRQASHSQLEAAARRRLGALMAEGVTTLEIKSGYGLDQGTEIKMLEVARRLGEAHPVDVRTTYLGAHALPREYAGDRAGYLDLICTRVLPEVAERGLADAVDAFCEGIAFTPDEVARVFEAARDLGLAVKLHADQLSDLGGAGLAARFGALSADHLEYASEAGIRAMAAAGTVAVLLPGAFYTLRERQKPPVALCRRHGVPMALATDCNPGSSPITSLRAILNLACNLFDLTPEEALAGVTRHAARALGLDDRGTLEVGKRADLALWRIHRPAELSYWFGFDPPAVILEGGQQSNSVTAR
ncbi:MAG: imidazolonepropionase [Geminicoccaceae bacterium]